MSLTDEQWAVIQPLLPPPSHPSPFQGEGPGVRARGRPPVDQRCVLDAILWKIRTSTPWYDLPPGFPSWQTCYRRCHEWQRLGLLNAVFSALDRDLRDRGGLNLRAALASQLIRFDPLGEQTYLRFDPSLQETLQDTWQLETVYLLVAVLFKVIRKKYPASRFRLVLPSTLAPQPVPLCWAAEPPSQTAR